LFNCAFNWLGGRGSQGTQARAFIKGYLKSCEFGPVPSAGGENLVFIPFATCEQFFQEYKMRCDEENCESYGLSSSLVCEIGCFQTAFNTFSFARCMRAKGKRQVCVSVMISNCILFTQGRFQHVNSAIMRRTNSRARQKKSIQSREEK